MLPAGEQEAGWAVLRAYCSAFNASFVHVERIFECQANPFVRNGRVDLGNVTGAAAQADRPPQGMAADTPVAFSLPSMVPGAVDAPVRASSVGFAAAIFA